MCLILFAHRAHPDLPLVVAANRDERYDRPTQPAAFWPEAPQVLAGKDLEAGGTWLGISQTGRFAAITNFRNGSGRQPALRSRGELTRDFLLDGDEPREYARKVLNRGAEYGGFNLLLGDGDRLVYCENLHNSAAEIPPGIYGLSNHLLDTPWPKVVSGKTRLGSCLEAWHSAGGADSNVLLDLLGDKSIAEDEYLPDTGVGMAMERYLSPMFIEGDDYGTCCSTVLIVDRGWEAKFHERSFYGTTPKDVAYEFSLRSGGSN